jgi:hypothetical protein
LVELIEFKVWSVEFEVGWLNLKLVGWSVEFKVDWLNLKFGPLNSRSVGWVGSFQVRLVELIVFKVGQVG